MSDDDTDREHGKGGDEASPAASRFPPGTSGNPKGRPRGSRNARTIVREIASENRKVRTEKGDERLTTFELVLLVIANKAMEGDARSVEFLDGYLERNGPPPRPDGAGYLIVPERPSEEEWARRVEANQRKFRTTNWRELEGKGRQQEE